MRYFGITDEGSRQSVQMGEIFGIVLPETPTTGYRWAITELTGSLVVIDDTFSPPQSMQPGAGGEHRWLLRSDHPGIAILRAVLARSTTATRGSSFDLTIEIAEAQ